MSISRAGWSGGVGQTLPLITPAHLPRRTATYTFIRAIPPFNAAADACSPAACLPTYLPTPLPQHCAVPHTATLTYHTPLPPAQQRAAHVRITALAYYTACACLHAAPACIAACSIAARPYAPRRAAAALRGTRDARAGHRTPLPHTTAHHCLRTCHFTGPTAWRAALPFIPPRYAAFPAIPLCLACPRTAFACYLYCLTYRAGATPPCARYTRSHVPRALLQRESGRRIRRKNRNEWADQSGVEISDKMKIVGG